ncbi:MAG: pyridoxal 5'-phosphate synthase glutaminase subunit PdxT, partial [Chloroflexota bacterium]|nr:pyridoxal 5'-phosphate synthase glutaminase subunit PdxT [Chloroflexota bacterium]
MEVGVLAIQGDFAEHIAVLGKLGVTAREIRLPEQLDSLDGLIIPGGESTTLSRLMTIYNLREP